jgi:hypothetical protein
VIESVRNPFQFHVARVLLLVEAFTRPSAGLRGWDTLARADFLLRYPSVLEHVLAQRGTAMPPLTMPTATERSAAAGVPLRFQFGPWDTRYYPVVARLVGCGLVTRQHEGVRPTFRVTPAGTEYSEQLSAGPWGKDRVRARLLAKHARVSAESLTRLIERAIADLETPHVPLIP